MRTIAIVNQKGGCGKTTTAINLAAVLARRGKRTLLVDMDPQSHCAAGLGVPDSRVEQGTAEALLADLDHPVDGRDVLWEVSRNLHLLPSTVTLSAFEAGIGGFAALPDRDRRLARYLAWLAPRFDICVIDCPPTIGFLTFNALRAADEVIVPVETGYFSLRGSERQVATIRKTVERLGRPLLFRLVATLYDEARPVDRDVLEMLRQKFTDAVLPVVVRDHELLREAASLGQAITEYAPNSQADLDFEALAEWLLAHPPELEIADHAHATMIAAPQRPAAPSWTTSTLLAPPIREPSLAASLAVSMAAPPEAPIVEPPSSRAAELVRRVRELSSRPTRGESGLPGSPSEHASRGGAASEAP